MSYIVDWHNGHIEVNGVKVPGASPAYGCLLRTISGREISDNVNWVDLDTGEYRVLQWPPNPDGTVRTTTHHAIAPLEVVDQRTKEVLYRGRL